MDKNKNKKELKPLHTKDLLLRPFKMTDLNDFYEYASQPEVGPRAGWKPHPNKVFTAKMLQSFVKNPELYAIVLKEENKVIGSIGIHYRPIPDIISQANSSSNYREIGYVLNAKYWGNGYMPQALSAVVYYTYKELELDFLAICHHDQNIQSKRVIEKCGFKYLGDYTKEMVFLDNEIRNTCAYILEFDKNWLPQKDFPYDGTIVF